MRWLATAVLVLLAQPAFASPLVSTHILTQKKPVDLMLELAANEADREHGLMNRKHLMPHDGMAFFFPIVAPQQFWMHDTLIPLDMLFVDDTGSIVYIATGKPLSEKPVGPTGPVATVIELAGGRAAKDGIAVGDKVIYDIDTSPSAMAH